MISKSAVVALALLFITPLSALAQSSAASLWHEYVLVLPLARNTVLLVKDTRMSLWGAAHQSRTILTPGKPQVVSRAADGDLSLTLQAIGPSSGVMRAERARAGNGSCRQERATFSLAWSPAIFEPILNGNDAKFTTLLRELKIVDVRDGNGRTPLMMACFYNRPEMVKALLARGASVDAKDKAAHTPLMMAVQYPNLVKLLLGNGAEPDAADGERRTALFFAIYQRVAEESIRRLIIGGADLRLVEKQWPFAEQGLGAQGEKLRRMQREALRRPARAQ